MAPTIAEVAAEAPGNGKEALASASASAAVMASAGVLLQALRSVHTLCQQVRDRPLATLQLHARLHQVFLRIVSGAKHGKLAADFQLVRYTSLLTQFKSLVEQHLRLKNVLSRLLASRRLLAGLAHVHHELDGLIVRYDLATPQSALMAWKQQFTNNQQQDEKVLHTTMMALLGTSFLSKEYASERRQALVLMELVCEFAPERERADRHSPQLLETFKMTHKRISNHCGLHLRRVPRWFLPTGEVDFSVKEHTIGLGGSFATTLYRGELFRGSRSSSSVATAIITGGGFRRQHTAMAAVSSTSTVAIKCLWALRDVHFSHIEELLTPFAPRWNQVNHPNVVSFRGGCHASNPPYLVRNYMAYGSLTSYLTALQSRTNGIPNSNSKMMSLTWQLLYGASRGLIYLHEQRKIVHGGLRCNNILVNKKGHAVIVDYGVYSLACEARSRNLTDHFLQQDAETEEIIRWQAPECLREEEAYRESLASLPASVQSSESPSIVGPPPASSNSFSTDVYAFGMCILEAFTREVPWVDLEITEIRSIKLNLGLLPPRPKHMSSRAWMLIQKMCAPDPSKRISMREVSQELKWLGYGDRKAKKELGEVKQEGGEQSVPTSVDSQSSCDKENAASAVNSQMPAMPIQDALEEPEPSRHASNTASRTETASLHSAEGSRTRSGSTRRLSSGQPRRSSKASHSREGSQNIWEIEERAAKSDPPAEDAKGNIWHAGQQAGQRSPNNQYQRSSSPSSSARSFRTVKAASTKSADTSGLKPNQEESGLHSWSTQAGGSAPRNGSDSEQPEHELESARGTRQSRAISSGNSSGNDRDSGASRRSSRSDKHPSELLSISDDETDGISSEESEHTAWCPPSVPVEFLTARSSDIDEEDEDEASQPRDEVAVILDNLKMGSQNESRLVEDLERLHVRLQAKTVELILKYDGVLILLEIVWRGYSVRASKLVLELLLAMTSLDPECISTIVNFEVIKILTAVIKHRPSPEEIDVAATLLLEIVIASDVAKEQLWKCAGIAIVEANDVINRRFVQELKSIMAKFKRGYVLACLPCK